jgi:hypothetical protein
MDEKELIAMAAFRIAEASKQLRMLAAHAETPALRNWLLSMAGDLGAQAARATGAVAAAEEVDRTEAGAARPSAVGRRRAS